MDAVGDYKNININLGPVMYSGAAMGLSILHPHIGHTVSCLGTK